MQTVQAPAIESLFERHAREQYEFKLLTETEKARFQIKMFNHYSKVPWAFLSDCVYTLDQVDGLNPIKPFPADLEYLQLLSELWIQQRLLAIPKSRRMTCSWNFIALYLQDTMFNKGRHTGFVSKKEDDSGELVARAEFIYQHIPDWRIPKALLPPIKNGKMAKQPPMLEFENIYSKIQGFAQGADQMRQFTLSGILGDECAFWEKAQKFYSASKPTIDGGGRMTLISSRSPGFFKKIVFDQLDAKDLTFQEKAPAPVHKPLEGVEVWTNPRNKFTVVDLHYTANPLKRGKVWRDAIRESMPIRDFLMEYEKSWQTYEGKPVYEDFNKLLHVVSGTIEPEPGIPLLLGWDFGLTPACIVAQLVGKQLRILKEYIELDGSILRLAPAVWRDLSVNFLPWVHDADQKIISFVDPTAINQRSQVDERTCAQGLRSSGFKKQLPGPIDWESRRQAVEKFLITLVAGSPAIIISEDDCPVLIEGFTGGYHYPEKVLEIEPTKIQPMKNKFSHPHDALQALCGGAQAKQKQYNNVPSTNSVPRYGFQERS